MVSSASKTKYQISTSCIKCKSQQLYYKLMQQIQIICSNFSLCVFFVSCYDSLEEFEYCGERDCEKDM